MKQLLKTTDKKAVESFLDQLYYQAACDTGNTRALIRHYYVKGNGDYEEVAQVSYNFTTGKYIIRM